MEENINIADILKDKPQGTKLYADAFGELSMVDICTEDELGVTLLEKDGDELLFYNDGKYNRHGEPILFPSKEMDDWSKFAWKKGDVLVSEGMGRLHVIFEGFDDDTYTTFKGKHYLCNYDDNEDYNEEEYNDYHKEIILRTIEFKKDNVNDAKTYINTIEERFGGKLNLETLEIDKHQHEFKDGDILSCDEDTYTKHTILILHKDVDITESIVSLVRHSELVEDNEPIDDFFLTRLYPAREDEKKELFDALAKKGKTWDAVKKQIVDLKLKIELKPFDKVLVRDGKDEIWEPAFFFRNRPELNVYKYQTVGGKLRVYCIPFNEETAKLIGTSNDWEE